MQKTDHSASAGARFDDVLLSREYLTSPYPFYQHLREAGRAHFSPRMNAWLLAHYRDVLEALRDPRLISGERLESYLAVLPLEAGPRLKPLLAQLSNWLGNLDPPHHTRLRKLVNAAFTPRIIERLRPSITDFVANLLESIAEKRMVDFVGEFAYPLPAMVIARMLGVPTEDIGLFIGWSQALTEFSGTGQPLVNLAYAARDSALAMSNYIKELAELRRNRPEEDLISNLLMGDDAGGKLSDDELASMCGFLLVAGHETTMGLLGNGLLALLRHPDQRRQLERDPCLIPNAVEELLRYDSPVQHQTRVAAVDMDIAGTRIRRGERVIPILGSANRDGSEFADPDHLTVQRSPNRHLAFGYGIHYCIGAPLARLEARVAFEAIVQHFPSLCLSVETVEWRRHTSNRNPLSLHIDAGIPSDSFRRQPCQ